MKIFLTGSEGAFGSEFINHLKGYEVLAPKERELDLTDFNLTISTIKRFRPDLICHLAAISDVDLCERDHELAYRVNVLATYYVTLGAVITGARILYISTNYVFDGSRSTPYYEWDSPNPINEYGRTKFLGEEVIRSLTNRYFIVRTAWLFGKNSKTFASKLIEKKEKPPTARVIADQFGSFTYIRDLSTHLVPIISTDYFGIYHLVNKGKGSWFDFLNAAKRKMGFSTEITPVNLTELKLQARRPPDAELGSRIYESIFGQSMRHWEEALDDFIKSLC